MRFFEGPHVDPGFFVLRAPLAMILGALERGRSHLSPGSKILKNDLLVLILQHERCSGEKKHRKSLKLLYDFLYKRQKSGVFLKHCFFCIGNPIVISMTFDDFRRI